MTKTSRNLVLLLAILVGTISSAGASSGARSRPKAPPRSAIKSTAVAADLGARGVVNINEADQATLELLPGIGEAKALRIIELRQRRPFRTTRDLMRVRGIGAKTLKRLAPHLSVKGPSTLTEKVRGGVASKAPPSAR